MRRIRLFLFDVDGVLTDGRLYHFVDTRGRVVELKGFHSQDGIALMQMALNGIATGLISGRSSQGVKARAKMLRMRHVALGVVDKLPVFRRILKRAQLRPEQVAYMGDDLPDLPVLRRVGWAVAPANARPEIRRAAHTVTRRRGGDGAVREAGEKLLAAQGAWPRILKKFNN